MVISDFKQDKITWSNLNDFVTSLYDGYQYNYVPVSLFTLAPPLTLNNVLRCIQGVQWRKLGEKLLALHKEKLNVIERENTSDQDQLRALVEFWLKSASYQHSWRRLIFRLDQAGELKVADSIRGFAEPPSGESS